MSLITRNQLVQICPKTSGILGDDITKLINDLCPKYGINTVDTLHEFIAQIAHESLEFTKKAESLNYSPNRLMEVWPSRFPTLKIAQQYSNDSQKLGNFVYANRMGNGNVASGDGFRNRGGGFIMATGKSMWNNYAKYKKMNVGELQRLCRSDNYYAMDISLWIFCIDKSLIGEAERDEFKRITIAINGGTIGLADRQMYYERAKKVLI